MHRRTAKLTLIALAVMFTALATAPAKSAVPVLAEPQDAVIVEMPAPPAPFNHPA